MAKSRKVLKPFVNMEVNFRRTKAVPGSIISEVCKAVGDGMVSGYLDKDGLRVSWVLYLEIKEE